MRLKSIGVSNYRNIAFARLDLDAPRVFLAGRNGQGKTNLLEAIGYLSALRAFRARESETLIGPEGDFAEIAYAFESEALGETRAQARIKRRGKEVTLDGERVRRASEIVGRFPTITLASEDLAVVRGSPGGRRRFLDTLLCGLDRTYYLALQRYQKALHERNALLKRPREAKLLGYFEREMAQPGLELVGLRRAALESMGAYAQEHYKTLSGSAETLVLRYRPHIEPDSADAYQTILEASRTRDAILQSTGKGPHRDDFSIELDGRAAAEYGSDGQQRSIALALAFASMALWRERFRISPILLLDDVLGELDPEREAAFWSILDLDTQLIASGTRLPGFAQSEGWLAYGVDRGTFARI